MHSNSCYGVVNGRYWLPAVYVRLLGLSLLPMAFAVSALEPYSLRSREYIQQDEVAYWQIRVTCSDQNTRRFINRYEEEGPWCAQELPGLCAIEVIDAATNVCSSSFRGAVAARKVNEADSTNTSSEQNRIRSELMVEKVSLQEQRLKLAERKLDLRRREMDLQKRELEILDRQERLF